MILYHGSERIVEFPIYGKSNSHNDYGSGFYCTENKELSKEWACVNNKNAFSNIYELNLEGLNILQLNSKEYTLLNWLAILIKNRTCWENSALSELTQKYISENFMIDISMYDVIVGYRADDSYFSFAQDFISGEISYRQLKQAMSFSKCGEQIVLTSEKAFQQIRYISSTLVDASVYYKKKKERDKKVRKDYIQTNNERLIPDEMFIVDIMRKEIKQDDKRLR